jgi:hypothetical protein
MRSRGFTGIASPSERCSSPSSTGASALVTVPVCALPARSKTPTATATGLDSPGRKKEIAMKLVSSAENSTLAWRKQYRYIEDIRRRTRTRHASTPSSASSCATATSTSRRDHERAGDEGRRTYLGFTVVVPHQPDLAREYPADQLNAGKSVDQEPPATAAG